MGGRRVLVEVLWGRAVGATRSPPRRQVPPPSLGAVAAEAPLQGKHKGGQTSTCSFLSIAPSPQVSMQVGCIHETERSS